MMEIKLSDHFGYRKLIRFTFSPIIMMIFTSIYGMVDGYFVSNYVGKTPFAALNLIWPFTMFLGAIGFMFGTGGTALVSKTMGEGDQKKANGYFSLIIYAAIALSIILDLIGILLMRPVAMWMGAEGELLEQAVLYGDIITAALPSFVLQFAFQPFMVAAEKPRLGLWMTVVSGCTNMVLDWLLIGVFGLGLGAAAAATVASQVVGAAWPLLYFALPNDSLLRLGRPLLEFRPFIKACTNGLSELVTNIALSFVSMIYNARLLILAGEDGVAAYGVIMYVAMLFLAIFFGYSMGSAPVISFHYGAQDYTELRSLRRKSWHLQSVAALIMTASAILASPLIAKVFAGYDRGLYEMTCRAFMIYSISFLLSHFNIFASSFFTALNDGITSAAISFSRMLIFQVTFVYVLPLFMGLDGIWFAMPATELCTIILSLTMYAVRRKRFHY